jgi:Family of unknown function (DUF6491)
MKSRAFWLLGTLGSYAGTLGVIFSLAACNAARSPREDYAHVKTEAASAQLRSDRVRGWTAPDDLTLIIEARDGTRYKADLAGPCVGLAHNTNLGFYSRGGFKEIDRFSSVVLSDGTRCPLATFNKIIPPEASALDEYEKGLAEEQAKKAEQEKTDAGKPDPDNVSSPPR